LVDGQGNENTMEARKDTHYAIDEAREVPVCFIYEAIAFNGMSCYELMNALDERAKVDEAFRPPRARAWNERSLVKLIRNPLYKGEFIANRFYTERVTVMDENGQSKTVRKTRQRPESEWVRVPVPPIVDEHTWEMANRNLYRNKGFARRNKKYEYMLTSIIRCDTCGWRYHGHTENKPRRIQRYYCSQIHTTPGYREHRPCGQPSIHCDVLDAAVWGVISDALLNPDVLLKAIDARYSNEQVRSTQAQIAFLEDQIEGKADEAEKLYRAYLAGAYTADEFAAERQRVTRARDVLTAEVAELRSHIMTPEQLEKEKRRTVELVQYARENVDIHDAPLTLKRQIVRLLVDEIILNVNEGWFELRGTVGAGLIFLNGDTPVVRTSTL
ncbi:MAG: recombinase family protein, partial [Anaerolineae bacterium]|nr:recombinase family protein [Anaerolineae bacterium]